ncbi:MAG: hypothetical protein ACYC8T_18345 [Myxococcaceae bacterium]
MRKSDLTALALCLSLLAGCDTVEVMRKVELAPEAQPPSAACVLFADTLRISTTGLEPLATSTRYVVWVETAVHAQKPVGALGLAGTLQVAVADLGMPLAEATGLLISEEPAGATLPDVVSARVRLRGPLEGPIGFTLPPDATFASGHAEVLVEDMNITTTASGLPKLGPGLSYMVWARMPADGAAPSHGHASEAADSHGPVSAVPLGSLDVMGRLVQDTSPESFATASDFAITVESDKGISAISPFMVLRGDVLLPQAGEAASVHTH